MPTKGDYSKAIVCDEHVCIQANNSRTMTKCKRGEECAKEMAKFQLIEQKNIEQFGAIVVIHIECDEYCCVMLLLLSYGRIWHIEFEFCRKNMYILQCVSFLPFYFAYINSSHYFANMLNVSSHLN